MKGKRMRYGERKHHIICLSSQNWDEVMWTNKQHIMSRLADDGHHVVHVDYGTRSLPRYLKYRFDHAPKDLLDPVSALTDGVVRRGESLYVGTHYAPPSALRGPRGSASRDFFEHDLKVRFLQQHLKTLPELPIVWVYHPAMGDAALKMERSLLVYDCVDDYQAFPLYKDARWLIEREERLCRQADLVFTTAPRLYELKQHLNPGNTHLVHNVGDADHFEKARDPDLAIAPELLEIKERGPVIGFVGAVSNYKLNMDWIQHAASVRSGMQFVLIGPVGLADPGTDVDRLSRMPNVHLLGSRDYADLPKYMKGFDVTVIPYRINQYTESVFPIKFFESLATGKPLVISRLPALEEFWEDALVADDEDGFVRRCEEALELGERGDEQRVALAREYSWPKRISKIMDHIEATGISK